jgi:hypothetical protein
LNASDTNSSRLVAVCLPFLCVIGGCATTIIPPQAPAEPVEVFILDHGRTTSLVVPTDGGMLRFAYGDWDYYALGRKDLYHGIAALLWPTRSALGRSAFSGAQAENAIRENSPAIRSLHALRVERARVSAFERSMAALYEAGREHEVENKTARLKFVPHPRPYTYLWNSNHAVASWLRELGCETRGASFHASWHVATGAPGAPGQP